MDIKNYDKKQIEFMAEEMNLPISKVVMLLDNPPTGVIQPCKDCKEKEKE